MDTSKIQIIEILRLSKSLGIALNNTVSNGYDSLEHTPGEFVNFGLCDYLGLSKDIRIRKAAADACIKYGVYTPISRTYMKLGIYKEAEEVITKLFGQPCIITQRATLGHICAIPAITEREDVIILDHHVHTSVSLGAQIAASQGCKIEMIRHNRLDLLEQKIQELTPNHRNIWYLTDGVYSMHGDTIPVNDIMALLEKYTNLHLYVDDSHGMSWAGKNGVGYFLSKVKFHPRLVMCVTLGKGYGCGGGAIICPDEETKEKIEFLGVPLMFTSPVTPPVLGAIIESSKIHFSHEIIELQNQLKERIKYIRKKVYDIGLPSVGNQITPITFVPIGKPEMGLEIGSNLIKYGIFITGGVFPAVPINNGGVRILAGTYHSMGDIDKMIEHLKIEYDNALRKRGITMQDVLKHYKHMDFYDGKELVD